MSQVIVTSNVSFGIPPWGGINCFCVFFTEEEVPKGKNAKRLEAKSKKSKNFYILMLLQSQSWQFASYQFKHSSCYSPFAETGRPKTQLCFMLGI